jgi:hypothetical protein
MEVAKDHKAKVKVKVKVSHLKTETARDHKVKTKAKVNLLKARPHRDNHPKARPLKHQYQSCYPRSSRDKALDLLTASREDHNQLLESTSIHHQEDRPLLR